MTKTPCKLALALGCLILLGGICALLSVVAGLLRANTDLHSKLEDGAGCCAVEGIGP